MSKIKSFFDFGLDFLFPADESVENIKNLSGEALTQLLPPSEDDVSGTETLFAYSDERVKHLVWEIKYYKNEKLANSVGILLAEKIKSFFDLEKGLTKQTIKKFVSSERVLPKEKFSADEKILVVPIPQTRRRFRERGFNHTELIARSALKNLPENFELATQLLTKVRHTPKQSSIENREDRFANISNAFAVRGTDTTHGSAQGNTLGGKNIILIDDVITTGATIAEARRALLSAGAKNVWAFAIAH